MTLQQYWASRSPLPRLSSGRNNITHQVQKINCLHDIPRGGMLHPPFELIDGSSKELFCPSFRTGRNACANANGLLTSRCQFWQAMPPLGVPSRHGCSYILPFHLFVSSRSVSFDRSSIGIPMVCSVFCLFSVTLPLPPRQPAIRLLHSIRPPSAPSQHST